MRVFRTLALTMTFVWSGAAFGNDNDCQDGNCDPELERLIRTCRNLAGDGQTKPFSTKVFCNGTRTFWKLADSGTFEMRTSAAVYNSADMKDGRYELREKGYRVGSDPTDGVCSTYQEMELVIPSIATVLNTCDELQDMADEGRDAFCERVLDGLGDEDDAEPTGRTHSNCVEPRVELELGVSFESNEVWYNQRRYSGLKVTAHDFRYGFIPVLGIEVGQTIVWINGERVQSVSSLKSKIQQRRSNNQEIEISVVTADGKLKAYK